jgi:hypothetical protein
VNTQAATHCDWCLAHEIPTGCDDLCCSRRQRPCPRLRLRRPGTPASAGTASRAVGRHTSNRSKSRTPVME